MRSPTSFGLVLVLTCGTGFATPDSDSPREQLIISSFPNRIIGNTAQIGAFAQDNRGRLYVGGDSLLVYDGERWKSFSIPESHDIFALDCDVDQRIWVGAYNQVGFYTDNGSGGLSFKSLRDQVPAAQRRFDHVWACHRVGPMVYFVCSSKILGWDGAKFSVWDFPTTMRLIPARLGDELWFTHRETGLYQLKPNGPELLYPVGSLPAMPAFGLKRDAEGLHLYTRLGIFLAGTPDRQRASPELVEFLRTRPLSSVVPLPDGNLLFGTLGGLALVSHDGRLLRASGQNEGLPSHSFCSGFLDREQQLWLGQAAGGIVRLDPAFPATLTPLGIRSGSVGVTQLLKWQGSIMALSETGLHDLQPQFQVRQKPSLAATPNSPLTEIQPHAAGLLIASFGALDLQIGSTSQRIHEDIAKTFRFPRPSTLQPEDFFCLINQKIARFSPGQAGQWIRTDLGELPELTNSCHADALDHLWFNSASTGVWHFDPSTRRLTNLPAGTSRDSLNSPTELAAVGDTVYLFHGDAAFAADIHTLRLTPCPGLPRVKVHKCIATGDGRGLYVIFTRPQPTGTELEFFLGRWSIQPSIDPDSRWTELAAPFLSRVGSPNALFVTQESGEDVLWVGGSENVMRILPARLTKPVPPDTPWLQVAGPTTSSPATGQPAAYPYSGQHFTILAGTAQIDARARLLFQTRLSPGTTDWSQPSRQHSFDLSDLRDGPHVFEVRLIDPAGRTSLPATYSFVILPPWYRHPLAYVTYSVLLAAGVLGLVRLRERRIRLRNEALSELVRSRTAELTKALAAKDEFLAGISHEIRNPMNGILGLADTIDEAHLLPSAQGQLTQLRHCASHLSVLLEDMLDFSRIQTGAVELNNRPFDLTTLVASLAALTTAESERSGQPLECAISPSVPRHLVGDVTRIRQILLNYLLNAFRYSGRGLVTLTVWTAEFSQEGTNIVFAVCDEGPGISRSEQARLFRRFERGAVARHRRIAGSGLGLALCQILAQQMSGRVWLESEPGQGACFYLALRLPVSAEAMPLPDPNAIPATGAGRSALVVDDEEYNLVVLTGYLRGLGFAVVGVTSGEAALAVAWQQDFSVIFLDVNLPGLSGPETARRLRTQQSADTPNLPILATTAYSNPETKADCEAAGMTAFLSKPITRESLRAVLSRVGVLASPDAPVTTTSRPSRHRLGRLRDLAMHRGTTLPEEISRYLAELNHEAAALTPALAGQNSSALRQTAHRLAGRLAFIQADHEAEQARQLEALVTQDDWSAICRLADELRQRLPAIHAQLRAEPPE